MKKFRFTKKVLAELPYPDGTTRVSYKDTQNHFLILRVSKKIKGFYYYRKLKGKPLWFKLGKFPEMTPAEARRKCEEKTKDIVCGYLSSSMKITFSELFNQYIKRHALQHRKTHEKDVYYFENYLEGLHNTKANQITREDITKLQGHFAKNNGKHTSNRILQMIRAIYNWGINNNVISCENPVSKVRLYKERSRDRFLSANEVKRFFEALETCNINSTFKDFFKLAIFTGQRKSNVLGMRWKDIDFDEKIWTIPGEFFKNGDPMKAILPDQAIEILLERIELYRRSEYVFPGKDNHTHIKSPEKSWNKIKAKAELKNIRIHDIRRTLGSWQASQGSSLLVIGKSLGHKSSQATEVYARMNLDPVRASVNNAVNSMVENINNKAGSGELNSLIEKVKNVSADNIQEYKRKIIELLEQQ